MVSPLGFLPVELGRLLVAVLFVAGFFLAIASPFDLFLGSDVIHCWAAFVPSDLTAARSAIVTSSAGGAFSRPSRTVPSITVIRDLAVGFFRAMDWHLFKRKSVQLLANMQVKPHTATSWLFKSRQQEDRLPPSWKSVILYSVRFTSGLRRRVWGQYTCGRRSHSTSSQATRRIQKTRKPTSITHGYIVTFCENRLD